jgi:WhiB family redox-sensing transcriptional regulator
MQDRQARREDRAVRPQHEEMSMTQYQDAPRPARLTAQENWRSSAACRSGDPDLFFPISGSGESLEQAAEAKAICAGCPVRRQCLAFALQTRQVYGIWGGLTERERMCRRLSALMPQPGDERTEPTVTATSSWARTS